MGKRVKIILHPLSFVPLWYLKINKQASRVVIYLLLKWNVKIVKQINVLNLVFKQMEVRNTIVKVVKSIFRIPTSTSLSMFQTKELFFSQKKVVELEAHHEF